MPTCSLQDGECKPGAFVRGPAGKYSYLLPISGAETSCQAVPQTSRGPLIFATQLTHTHGRDFKSIQESSGATALPVLLHPGLSTSTFLRTH